MLYNDLLLSRGGGIIPDNIKVGMDNCAVINIGLGGTGIDCLKILKKKVYKNILPDNSESDVPEYSHIEFLAIDSNICDILIDDKNRSVADIDPENEFFNICVYNIKEVLGAHGHLNKNPNMKWLAHEPDGGRGEIYISPFDDINCSSDDPYRCGIRQIGRFSIISYEKEFSDRIISELLKTPLRIASYRYIYVNIFTGLGGATGSGIFLDVCYMIQEIAKRINMSDNVILSGYCVMPDVNLSMPWINNDRLLAEHIKRNGYASLKELDYCMNFENNGDEWSQFYDGLGKVNSKRQPFDICYLVCGRDINGNRHSNTYEHTLNVISDYCLDTIIDSNAHLSKKVKGALNCKLKCPQILSDKNLI